MHVYFNLEVTNKILKSELIEWKSLEWLQGKLKAISEDGLKKLKQSLINNSFIQPFNVWQDKDGKIWILDGHHRKLAMEQLELEGYDIPVMLPANFVDCKDKKEAKKFVLIYSSIYAQSNEQTLAEFLAEDFMNFEEIKNEIKIPDINENFLSEPNFSPASLDEQGQLDKKKKVECPNCGETFEPK